ncbi:DEAD/DEAH box helicase, partial [Candidatus Woesearchaeota archaeon]|nr:DEAD/DEAH box helicase [Candidatus Woesearchaeota archaeon]
MITPKEKADSQKTVEAILHPAVKQWFFSKFKEFSLPQLYGVTEVHARNNILVSAGTGSGKTLTSFLAILNELVDCADKGILEEKIYAVYVSPLKALNRDVSLNLLEPLEEIEKIFGKAHGIKVAVRTGDTTQYEKTKMLRNPPHILITTPESLALLLSSKKFAEH